MIAEKDLEPGDVILSEPAFVVGPKSSTYPLCLSCYTPWPIAEDTRPLCSKCGWPVCGPDCENAPQHRDYECPVSNDKKKNKFIHLIMKIINSFYKTDLCECPRKIQRD